MIKRLKFLLKQLTRNHHYIFVGPSLFLLVPCFQPLLRIGAEDKKCLKIGATIRNKGMSGTKTGLKRYNDGLNMWVDLVKI